MKSFWQNNDTLQFVSLVKFTIYAVVDISYYKQRLCFFNASVS